MSILPTPVRGSDLGFVSFESDAQPNSPRILGSAYSSEAIQDDETGKSPDSSDPRYPPQVSSDRSGSRAGNCRAASGRTELDNSASEATAAANSHRKLHRIAEVRKSQGISERSMCKRLNIDLQSLRQLEDPTRDISLTQLMAVQAALDVPLVDLLEDSNSLSRPVEERAKLVKVMKTAAAIRECKLGHRASRLAEMLAEQLVELMPELAEVSSWPQFGSRRGAGAVARVLEQEINMSQIKFFD